jgi:NADH dehydrogenase
LRNANRWFGSAVDADRFRSLTDLPPISTAGDLDKLALPLRPFFSGIHASGSDRRRKLMREGRALLSYVLRQRPPAALVRRYVRMVEAVRGGEPVSLPAGAIRFPASIALLDSHGLLSAAGAHELIWRLDAATLLAEASPAGARRFLQSGVSYGAIKGALRIANVLGAEALVRTARWLSAPFLRRAVDWRHERQRRA